jgi:hypothetical protein
LRLDRFHRATERAAFLLDIGTVSLIGVLGLLLAGQSQAAQGPPQGCQTASEAAPLAQLLQGGVGLLADQFREASPVVRPQGKGRATPVRLRVQGAGVAASLEQADDEREVDAEPSGDLALGALMMINCGRNPLAQILRVGTHDDLLRLQSPGASASTPREFFPSATRKYTALVR